MKYVLISVDDARWLAHAVDGCAGNGPNGRGLVGRLKTDDGGDFDEIIRELKTAESCPDCCIESQEEYCNHIDMRRIGRRLDRLLERAQPGGRAHRLPT